VFSLNSLVPVTYNSFYYIIYSKTWSTTLKICNFCSIFFILFYLFINCICFINYTHYYNKQQFTHNIFTLNKNQRAVCDFAITCTYAQFTIVTPYHYKSILCYFFGKTTILFIFPLITVRRQIVKIT